MSRRILIGLSFVSLAVLAACSDSTSPDTTRRAPDAAAAVDADVSALQAPGEYIVVLKEGTSDVSSAAASITARGGRIKDQWEHALKGFLVELPAGIAIDLARRSDVAIVEKNGIVTADATQLFPPSWGLDRIDQRPRPLNNAYTYNRTGLGVHAYIIDTGIRPTHTDFAGRVLGGITVIADGNGTNDCNGHGTHVAGTVGGTQYGVAKRVWLHPVRVLNCAGSGTFAGVIAGINWVAANKISPAVANLSLGGGFSAAVNNAVNNLVNMNVATAVAAGNSNLNACGSSPASAVNPLTVGATTITDFRAGFSNFGPCLDLFAPGVNIRSAWHTSNVASAVLNGTSMASPHVAGVAAQLRQAFPLWTAFQVQNTIRAQATVGLVVGAGVGSPNRLLYMGFIP
ncbi:MAG: S8 family peptidase [Cytophagaceae bacterium]|nr:S8 family peptidase [Gemmatimonadaceae bacterium]